MRACLGLFLLACAAASAEDLSTLLESKVNPDDYAVKQDEFGLRAPNPIQNLDARFRPDGVVLTPHRKDDALKTGALVRLRTGSWGRAGLMHTLENIPPVQVGDRVEYPRPGLTEWYLNGASGLEQGFTVADRPSGTGELRVQVQVSAARASLHGDRVRLVSDGGRALSFGQLRVKDAAGRELRARLEVPNPATVALVVEDCEAQYPIVIDPTLADDHWQAGFNFNGANSQVNAILCTAGVVYAGGYFTCIGDQLANGIAKWSPGASRWSTLGVGVNGHVDALAVDGSGNIYAGGALITAGGASVNNIAKWTPGTSTWSALGTGMNGTVKALALDVSGNLYAGGDFTTAGGAGASHIAKWDGTAWSALTTGTNGSVYALAGDTSGNVYAGGPFASAGDVTYTKYIAKWNGSAWSPLGTGMDGTVNALALDSSGNLYVGGQFTKAGGADCLCIARWNPNSSSWSALGTGMNSYVCALAVDQGTNVYAGGWFTTAGGVSVKDIAKWDGNAWSALGSGLNNAAVALAVDDSGNLYAGGSFTTAGEVCVMCIAEWVPATSSWCPVWSGSTGVGNGVSALALDASGNVYAGGSFTQVGGRSAKNIAKWTPSTSTWSALTTGTNDEVMALAVDGSGNLYAGGYFTTAGGVSASRIAKWDGAAWSALGAGMGGGSVQGVSPRAFAIAVDGSGNVYVGGDFTTAGGVSAKNIAKWDGQVWSALGTGMGGTNPYVYALAIGTSGTVYAAGSFTTAGGSSASYVAQWTPGTPNGSWSALGTGMNGGVEALCLDGSGNLYAGGGFTTAGGVSANNVAKWTSGASAWSALGTGTNGGVYVLAADGSGNVYAGGGFNAAGGVSASSIAKWIPSVPCWRALGSGANSYVSALVADSTGHVYAGGGFYIAGGKVSAHFGHFYNRPPICTSAPTVTGIHLVGQTLTANPGTWSDPDDDTVTCFYRWERASDGAGGGAAAIAGATNSTYVLCPADDLTYVRVTVIADDGASGVTVGSTPWLLVGGYEADVGPRDCGGDATVSIADWVQVGRFAAALDTVGTGSEFQKADCAPRSASGDGVVGIADWVQAGRYAAALDDLQTIGGPTAPAP